MFFFNQILNFIRSTNTVKEFSFFMLKVIDTVFLQVTFRVISEPKNRMTYLSLRAITYTVCLAVAVLTELDCLLEE